MFPLSNQLLNLMHAFPSYMKQPSSGNPRPREKGSVSSRRTSEGHGTTGVTGGDSSSWLVVSSWTKESAENRGGAEKKCQAWYGAVWKSMMSK